ncbi:hypothetical protein BD309DRAFT_983583 [Dichomitus squalens]|nr:hypothetical protein BD309DRAFT_983583 [Dichomitus squalens]
MHMARILLLTSGYCVIAALSAYHDDADDLTWAAIHATGLVEAVKTSAGRAARLLDANLPLRCAPISTLLVSTEWDRWYLQVDIRKLDCRAIIDSLPLIPHQAVALGAISINHPLPQWWLWAGMDEAPADAWWQNPVARLDPWMPMHWDDLSHLQLDDNTFKKVFRTALSFAEKSTPNVRAAEKVLMSSLEALDRKLFPKEK